MCVKKTVVEYLLIASARQGQNADTNQYKCYDEIFFKLGFVPTYGWLAEKAVHTSLYRLCTEVANRARHRVPHTAPIRLCFYQLQLRVSVLPAEQWCDEVDTMVRTRERRTPRLKLAA